eukprot:14587701-Heterocapsa_arctica.AAC.1
MLLSSRVNRRLLQMVLGSFVPAFTFRRKLMSVWHHTYSFSDSLPDSENKWRRLPPDIRDEPYAASALLAVAECHIRWRVSSVLSATDATMTSFGATESDVGGKISRALYRIAEHRGEHTRLDWANSVDSMPHGGS